jgi:hypothetical protein
MDICKKVGINGAVDITVRSNFPDKPVNQAAKHQQIHSKVIRKKFHRQE